MTLYVFKYCLPILLGYTLFVGLSGRMNPLRKPEYLEERPSWLLGLWSGLSVAIVTMVGLHMAYSMTLEGVRNLLPPTALFMALLLSPGFLMYFHYRRIIASELQVSRTLRASREMLRVATDASQEPSPESSGKPHGLAESTTQQSPVSINHSQDNMRTKDTSAPVVATFLDSADLQILDTHEKEAANHDSATQDSGYLAAGDAALEDYMDETIFEELHYSALDLDEATLEELSLTDPQSVSTAATSNFSDPGYLSDTQSVGSTSENFREQLLTLPDAQFDADDAYGNELLFEPVQEISDEELEYLFDADAMPLGEENDNWFEIDNLAADEDNTELQEVAAEEPAEALTDNATFLSELELLESDLRSDDADSINRDSSPDDDIESRAAVAINTSFETYLEEERKAHQETARQLYATRKVLASLTSGSEGAEAEKTASFLQMKEELAQRRTQYSTLEASMQQEVSRREELESAVAELQSNLIISKQDVRRSTAARAKALSTANKAIAFARQTLQVRALLEEELDQVRETLTHRQATISSLIKELEHEKERTQEEVSFMVQQLVLHEQQLKARRNLQNSPENLTTALPTRAPKQIETQSLSPDL